MQQAKRVQAFLKTVCRQVRWKQAHETIARDLANHIEDQTEAYVRGGNDEATASARAIQEMGDPVEIGLQLDASYRPQVEWPVIIPLIALLLLGTILQLILYRSIPHLEEYAGESYAKLGLSLSISGLFMVLAYHINLYKLYKFSWVGYGFICISLILRSTRDVPWLGYQGDANWLYVSLIAPVFLAGILYSLRGKGIWRVVVANAICAIPMLYVTLWSGGYLFGLLPCLIAGLVVLLSFLSSGQLHGKWWHILIVSVLTWCVALLLLTWNWQKMTINPFRYKQFAAVIQRRMRYDYSPYSNSIREILEHAKLFGQGALTPQAKELFFERMAFGEPVSGLEWMFMADYFVTYLIYKFGWAAGIIVVAALLGVIVFGYARCFRLESVLGRLLSLSILSVYSLEILMYLLGCFGFTRLGTPFPLPFVSVGYRSQIAHMALMGMLLNLFRTDGLFADRSVGKRPTLAA